LVVWLVDWGGWSVGWLVGWLVGWSVGVGRTVSWWDGWSVGCSVGWMVSRWFDWSVGEFANASSLVSYQQIQ